ncbi:SUKH-4 family immunity protein [Paenibacillus sp. GYB003]|uniref:SUKH-4 family immunity protein n=1 Tax=Paenibacillus sp. GYB003 TaxID=2994392 RepID=UPI002F965976
MTLEQLYANGVIPFDRSMLEGNGRFPSDAIEWLARHGLPRLEGGEVLGVSFLSPAIKRFDGEEFIMFASERWREDLWIGIGTDGAVYALGPVQGRRSFINSNLEVFLQFMAHVSRYLEAAKATDTGPTVMTRDVLQERLAALRNGKIRPAARATGFDRQFETERLECEFRTLDRAALKRDGWWCKIIEQLRDGLI